MMRLGASMGRDAARRLLADAVREMTQSRWTLAEVLASMPQVTAVMSSAEIRNLDDPETYLGAAETFRKQLLASSD